MHCCSRSKLNFCFVNRIETVTHGSSARGFWKEIEANAVKIQPLPLLVTLFWDYFKCPWVFKKPVENKGYSSSLSNLPPQVEIREHLKASGKLHFLIASRLPRGKLRTLAKRLILQRRKGSKCGGAHIERRQITFLQFH